MSAEAVFAAANAIALLAWILLAVLPARQWVTHVVTTTVAVLFAVAYVFILSTSSAPDGSGFGSLAAVSSLFSVPRILLAGWLHYLAFDLLVGSWEVRDARERGVSHWLVVPCLFGTFMFGPAGWLAYMGLRTFARSPRASQRTSAAPA